MNEITKTRVKFFVGIIAFIIVLHIVVIFFLMPDKSKKTEAAPADAPVAGEVAKTTDSAYANEETPAPPKPGFWSRLFGKKEEVKPAAPVKPAEPPKPAFKYKVPSTNPNYGKPFNFSTSAKGNISVPGSDGAGSGIMVDLDTRNVLWEKDPHKSVPIASMVKMMTTLLIFEAMEKNPALNLDTPVQITKTATSVKRTGVVWLDTREVFPISDLLKAIIIKSANDAATQMGEFIGGDVGSFVRMMNARALELGMTDSKFVSPCGLPDKTAGNSMSSANDMVIVAEQLLVYPKVLELSSTLQDSIREGEKKTVLTTTNKLINPHWPGVDGLKTGFINESGFCLTFSVLRNGKRIVGCVTGFKTGVERDRFCRKLIDWGYARADALQNGTAKPEVAAAPAAPAKATKPAAKPAAKPADKKKK